MRNRASSILFLFFFPCYIYAQNPLDLLKGKGSSTNSGLFHYVAVEEREIRKNPLARTSDVLKRVFTPQ